MTTTHRIRPTVRTASGRRRGWIKHVTDVDETKVAGYALEGDFLAAGREVDLPAGAVLVHVYPCGSVKNSYKEAQILRVSETGELESIAGELDWRDSFLSIRDQVAELIGTTPSPLAGISDAELLAEVARRGLTVA